MLASALFADLKAWVEFSGMCFGMFLFCCLIFLNVRNDIRNMKKSGRDTDGMPPDPGSY